MGGWEDGGLEEEMKVTEKLEEYGAKLRQNEEKYQRLDEFGLLSKASRVRRGKQLDEIVLYL